MTLDQYKVEVGKELITLIEKRSIEYITKNPGANWNDVISANLNVLQIVIGQHLSKVVGSSGERAASLVASLRMIIADATDTHIDSDGLEEALGDIAPRLPFSKDDKRIIAEADNN